MGNAPVVVNIKMQNGENISCRTYEWLDLPEFRERYDNLPSLSYLKTVVKGALESELPADYVSFLRKFKHNGKLIRRFEDYLYLDNVKL